MNCEDSRSYLAAYLDDELEVAGILDVQKHLAACADCRRTQEERLALRSALRVTGLYAHPSVDLENRIAAAVRAAAKEEARPSRSFWLGSFRWVPAAAALAVVTTLGALFIINGLRSTGQREIASAVVAGHVRSLQADHLVDVPSSDRHTVRPWFQGKLDFSPPVPDLTKLGFTLAGGRLDYLDERPVAAIVYQLRKHNINVFVWPSHGRADSVVTTEDAHGYHILTWNGSGMTYWVVSDLSGEELLELARALRGH